MAKTATVTPLHPKPINKRVGGNVKIIMGLRDRTQTELAELLHVTQSSMSRRIKGTTDWAPDEMVKVAEFLRVDVSRLFEKLPDLEPFPKD